MQRAFIYLASVETFILFALKQHLNSHYFADFNFLQLFLLFSVVISSNYALNNFLSRSYRSLLLFGICRTWNPQSDVLNAPALYKTTQSETLLIKMPANLPDVLSTPEVLALYREVLAATDTVPASSGWFQAFMESAMRRDHEGMEDYTKGRLKQLVDEEHVVDLLTQELAQEVGQETAATFIAQLVEWSEWIPIIGALWKAQSKITKDLDSFGRALGDKALEIHMAAFIETAINRTLYVCFFSSR